jgi:hypothetical protein
MHHACPFLVTARSTRKTDVDHFDTERLSFGRIHDETAPVAPVKVPEEPCGCFRSVVRNCDGVRIEEKLIDGVPLGQVRRDIGEDDIVDAGTVPVRLAWR